MKKIIKMKYSYKNLRLKIVTITNYDLMGDVYYELSPEIADKFFTDYCDEGTDTIDRQEEEDKYIIGSNEIYIITNADLMIALFSWMLSQDKIFIIEIEYSHIFWAIHDLLHAENDENNCSIYVDKYIEEERIFETFEILQEKGIKIDFDFIKKLEEIYYLRFKKQIDLDNYYLY